MSVELGELVWKRPDTTSLEFIEGIRVQVVSLSGFFTLDPAGESNEEVQEGVRKTEKWSELFGISCLTSRILSL